VLPGTAAREVVATERAETFDQWRRGRDGGERASPRLLQVERPHLLTEFLALDGLVLDCRQQRPRLLRAVVELRKLGRHLVGAIELRLRPAAAVAADAIE